MRTNIEVVFDGEFERKAFTDAGRWIGAEGEPDSEIERGGRAVRHHNRNHAYNYRVLTFMLAWIEASVPIFEDRRVEGHRIKAAATHPDRPESPIDESRAGIVLIESAADALNDLAELRPMIEQALQLASPPVPDRKYAGV